MSFSFTASNIPATSVMAHIPLAVSQIAQSVQNTTAMQIAAQIGQATLLPASFFGQVNTNRYVVSRVVFSPTEPQKLDFDQKKRREFIRGVIVTKTDTSSDTNEKQKE